MERDKIIFLIIIAAVVIIALTLVLIIFSWFGSCCVNIPLQDAFSKGCEQLREQYGCNPDGVSQIFLQYQQPGDNGPQKYSFAQICDLKFDMITKIEKGNYLSPGEADPKDCARQCGC